jgi:hypothetical protein
MHVVVVEGQGMERVLPEAVVGVELPCSTLLLPSWS